MKGKAGPRPGPVKKKDAPKEKPAPEKKAKKAAGYKPGPDVKAPKAAEAKPGHNNGPREMNEDDVRALYGSHKKTYLELLKAKNDAASEFTRNCKLFRADLGADAIANIKLMIQLDTPAGEALVRERINREVKVARWAGVPVGTQGDIFEVIDRAPADEKAYELGKRHALAGQRAENPHSPPVKAYHEYIRGYQDGNAIAAKGIKQKQKPPKDDEFSPDLNNSTDAPPAPSLN